MGRREVEVTISADGRDLGKKFKIVEMPSAQAEWWAMRLLNGLATAKVDMGAVQPLMGMAGLAQGMASLGVLGLDAMFRMPLDLQKPLLDEMFGCIQIIQPSPRAISEAMGDIEEVATRIQLREEVLSLHLGFSLRDRVLAIYRQLEAAAQAAQNSSNTPTSLELSEP